MKTFKIGKTYFMQSICDSDCKWFYTVTARTASTITITNEDGKTQRCYVREILGAEACKPLGSYSMAPTLSADRLA